MVRLGIVDSGIDPEHSILRKLGVKVTDWKDFADGAGEPEDTHGHGTRVAEHAAQVIAALAPEEPIELAVARVFGEETGDLTGAVKWMAQRDVPAVNLSLGLILHLPSEVALDTAHALRDLQRGGVVPVVAGGNGVFNAALVPTFSPLNGFADLPWVLSVGWPMLTTGLNTDVVETAHDGSSFSAPQAAAKAALLNAEVRDADLATEALMATAASEGPSHPAVTHGSPDVAPALVCRLFGQVLRLSLDGSPPALTTPRTALAPLEAVAGKVQDQACGPLMEPGFSCTAPGRCGWGYPRLAEAQAYVKARTRSDWFRAGEVPKPSDDPRWAAWAPGYLVRLRHAAVARATGAGGGMGTVGGAGAQEPGPLELTGAEGAIEEAQPLAVPGLSLVGGRARALVATPRGEAHVAGVGTLAGDEALMPPRDGVVVKGAVVVAGAWLGNGRWLAVTQGRPRGVEVRFEGRARPIPTE